MIELFPVDSRIVGVEPLPRNAQVVFHAMNKSGSEALSDLLWEAFEADGRSEEYFSHFRMPLSQSQFVDLVSERRSQGGVFIDHYMYGGLPPWPSRVYMTQFRHPLSRLLSSYNWLKRIAQNDGDAFPDFKGFVEESNGVSHSLVVQLGTNWRDVDTPEWISRVSKLNAEQLFDRSIEALEREIYAVGIAEYFEESIFLYATLLGLTRVPPWRRDKRNEDRPLSGDIDKEAIELVEHVNKWDYTLYEYAKKRFESQFIGIEGCTDLTVYKRRCEGEYRDRLIKSI